MTTRDENLFVNGLLVGAALMAREQQDQLAELDARLRKMERELPARLMMLVGRRNGQRTYRIIRWRA